MSFASDAFLSMKTSAYEKAHRLKMSVLRLPSLTVTAFHSPGSSSNSFLGKESEHIRQPFHRSNKPNSFNSLSLSRSAVTRASKPVPATESPFFRLPLELRETIYGLVVGRREMLHILKKLPRDLVIHPLGYRRCRRGGNIEECILRDCKGVEGFYFGPYNSIGGLLFSCRDIFQEVSNVLYTQNIFEFDHPQSFVIFQKTVHAPLFNSIKSISINMRRDLYTRYSGLISVQDVTSFQHDVWPYMWKIIAGMESLEQVKVTFRFPLEVEGWLGWSEKRILDPLCEVTRPMRVFEVDCQVGIAYRDGEYAAAPFKLVGNHA